MKKKIGITVGITLILIGIISDILWRNTPIPILCLICGGFIIGWFDSPNFITDYRGD